MSKENIDFKKDLQVNSDNIIDINKMIEEVETGSRKYNGQHSSNSEQNIFRSGQVMTYDALLSAGLLFKIHETCGDTVDAHMITRIKSKRSIDEKTHRKNRQNKENIGDIIGSSLIMDKVHNYSQIVNIFNSPEIQIRYNERQANIYLLREVSQFIIDLNSEEHNIASDLDDAYSKNNNELVSRLNINKKDCKGIKKNCTTYLKESKTNLDAIPRFPIHRTLKSMCRELINEEIQKAFYRIDANLKSEINNKEVIEQEIEELQQFNDDNENERIIYLQNLLSVQEKKIDMLKEQIALLKKNIDNKDALQLKILLSNCLNNERIELLEEIEKHITTQINMGGDPKEDSLEKKYCQYLTIVLYQIKKLEYINPQDKFKGKTYETVENTLYSQLKEYRNAEIEGNTYKNLTFDDIQKLTTNLRRLNSRLSDKLQHGILDYSMQLYLSDVIKEFTGEEPSNPDLKIKQNGYVATHIDIDLIKTLIQSEEENKSIRLRKELKLVTHHRNLESTTGTAAYGSGRQENMEAKKRKNELLETTNREPMRVSKGPKIKSVNMHGNTSEQLEKAREENYFINIIKNTKISETKFTESLKQKIKWQEKLFSVIPKYSYLYYNKENDSVELVLFSDYENIKKYYTETNLPIKRTQVINILEELKSKKMVSSKPINITITHEQFRYFMRNQLGDLKKSIIDIYGQQTRSPKSIETDIETPKDIEE